MKRVPEAALAASVPVASPAATLARRRLPRAAERGEPRGPAAARGERGHPV